MSERTPEAIIYGGAFNPPTLAHTTITKACIDFARERGAEVWLLPSGSRTDKTIDTPREQRLAYLKAMIKDVGHGDVRVSIKTDEIDRIGDTETFDTVCQLAARYPEVKQTWVFGADSLTTMHEWKKGEWLARNLSMLVFRRLGTEESEMLLSDNINLIDVETPAVSSTMVREALKTGSDITDYVGHKVRELLLH